MNKWKKPGGSKNHEYWYISDPKCRNREVKHSRWVVEEILGKHLPPKAVVHHVDGNSLNDEPSNLVLCENDAYHKLLHLRTDALRATGNPHSRRCKICKQWGIPGDGDMVVHKRNSRPGGDGVPRHRSCHREDMRKRGGSGENNS